MCIPDDKNPNPPSLTADEEAAAKTHGLFVFSPVQRVRGE
jgi:hypothetical protein